MSVYEVNTPRELLSDNDYPGRGIMIGKSADGKYAVVAYFIMGRSENSRNRVFVERNGSLVTEPHDPSKVADPSLIIYSALRTIDNKLVVTNGDQTDTIVDAIAKGGDMRAAIRTREFEPDPPNLTPRISGVLTFLDGDFSYEMSIAKSADADGTACNRFFYEYSAIAGVGHFIHTYVRGGNPLPTFVGEPERVSLGSDIDEFTTEIWQSLNEENKISLCTMFIDLKSGEKTSRLINKNK